MVMIDWLRDTVGGDAFLSPRQMEVQAAQTKANREKYLQEEQPDRVEQFHPLQYSKRQVNGGTKDDEGVTGKETIGKW